jgi:hypothetical protein
MIESISRRRLLALAILCEGGLILIAWGFGWLLATPAAATLSWTWRDAFLGVLASGPMLLLFLACVAWPKGPLARIDRSCRELIVPLFASCTVADLALISSLAGLGEELLFRGVLQGYLSQRFGDTFGLGAASLVFGLFHPLSAAYIVLATVMGAYLGFAWTASGNLLVPIVAHGLYDFLALSILLRRGQRISTSVG